MKNQLKFATALLAAAISCNSIAEYRYIQSLTFDTGIKAGSSNSPAPSGDSNEDSGEDVSEGVWISIAPSYTAWIASSEPQNCQTWLPDMFSDSVKRGANPQTSNDCTVQKTRTKQNMEQNTKSGLTRPVGEEEIEEQTFNDGVGSRTLVVTLKNWTTTGTVKDSDCESWSPSADTFDEGVQFGQTGTNCQNIEQTLRVKGSVDGVSSNVYWGTPEIKSNINVSRTAIGTKTYEWGKAEFSADSYYNRNDKLNDPASGVAANIALYGNGKVEIYKNGFYKLDLELTEYQGNNETTKVSGKPYFKFNDCDSTANSCTIEVDAPIQVLENGIWRDTTVYSSGITDQNSRFILAFKKKTT